MVDWLFAQMLGMFGRQWVDLWGSAPIEAVKAEWRAALDRYDVEAIRRASYHLRVEGRDFPPNLSQFVALTRQFVRRGAHRLALADNRRTPPPQGFQALRDVLNRVQVPRK